MRGDPGKVDYGTSGVGTLNHLVMEQFKHASGVPSMAVPYRLNQAFTDAMGDRSGDLPGVAAATRMCAPVRRAAAVRALCASLRFPTFRRLGAGYEGIQRARGTASYREAS
jgi:tripartite-type tricarboxylate transporter receptor subunit TctC